MEKTKVLGSIEKTMATTKFMGRLGLLIAVVFVLAIVGIFASIPQTVMLVVTGIWFVLLALMILSSVFWTRSHLNPE